MIISDVQISKPTQKTSNLGYIYATFPYAGRIMHCSIAVRVPSVCVCLRLSSLVTVNREWKSTAEG